MNINSLRYKIEALADLIRGNLDILVVAETKLDSTFPEEQFRIEGYKKPYRFDRNGHGGGVMIYVREDIPSNPLIKHKLVDNVEALVVEINLRKNKLLLIGAYHSTSLEFGTTDEVFFEQMGLVLDLYNRYDKFLLVGDLNVQEGVDGVLDEFMDEFHAKNLVKERTCFKNPENPSCIDMFITNSSKSFQKTTTVSTGLSDFHKMIVTVMRTTFPKSLPKVVTYRDFSKYNPNEFGRELRIKLDLENYRTYESFQNVFMTTLNLHAPQKKKTVRANHKPYVTKKMRKAIMLRSQLENKYFSHKTDIYWVALKKQRAYCTRLYKRERRRFYSNLSTKNITDNKKFWLTVKPLFGNKGNIGDRIVLIEQGQVICDDKEIAETFNNFFGRTVKSLGIVENKFLLNKNHKNNGLYSVKERIDDTISMFETHPSIISIKNTVKVDGLFSFTTISVEDMEKEIQNLNPKKAGTFMDIPTKQLKEVSSVVSEPLAKIWNEEVIGRKVFPAKLKLADITPIYKSLENTSVTNYRPVSILPVVSKVFERIMDKQTNSYMDSKLSPYLCGYRKGYSCQYALLSMIERWKLSYDKGGHAGGILMDLSKAFDTINHQLLVAKLHAYGFSKDALEIIYDYLSDRWQRTKINTSLSTWSEILSGIPQGSVNGPKYFNIYINDLFLLFLNTKACNMADDTTPYACEMDLPTLLHNLESDAASAILWFENNYMKLNNSKCHLLITSRSPEIFWAKVGSQVIWESHEQKLLGITLDKRLKFDKHVLNLCKKASGKLTALGRLVNIVPTEKKKILMNSFIQSQFSYCPLLWMFCNKKVTKKIDRIQERGLRMVYQDYTSSFKALLMKNSSVTIHQRNIQLVAVEMFKIKHNICPEIMKDLFQLNVNYKYSKNDFVKPKVNSVYKGEWSLRWFGPMVWDTMLPESYKQISTLNEFKQEIKKWVPENCPCKTCKEYIRNIGYITIVE